MRPPLLAALLAFALTWTVARPAAAVLAVHPSGRYLVDERGKPFFWLGDTAWLLPQMADRADAAHYLKARARQGFTVIQAALVMGEERVGGTQRPNRLGDVAFVDGDPGRPLVTPGKDPRDAKAYDYWDHVDFIVQAAEEQGLVMAVLPLFVGNKGDGYKHLTEKNAHAYGRFLGERYKARRLIWLMGGDHEPKRTAQRATWDLLAKGITEAVAGREDYGRTLMSYHISGGHTSSEYFQHAVWLDFNMIQTWDDFSDVHSKVRHDWHMNPPRPTGLGEGAYEDGPQYPTRPINALVARKQAYLSYFGGGYHTYGNTNVWSFGTFKPEVTEDWKAALDSPGVKGLTVLRGLFRDLPWWKLDPERKAMVRVGEIGSGNKTNLALQAMDGTGVLVYVSGPDRVTVDMTRITAAPKVKVSWLDPRNGARRPDGERKNSGEQTFATPRGWEDAVLILDAGLRTNTKFSPPPAAATPPAGPPSAPVSPLPAPAGRGPG